MKRILLVLLPVLFFSTLSWADEYTFDPNHTFVTWHASHFGFSNPAGKWPANGTVVLDENNPGNSKVNVTIKIEDLVTGINKFDHHLKSEDFFNAAKYPTATFVSDRVTVTGKNSAQVHGTLTVLGVSKPVTLEVILNKKGISPINNKETAGFTAKTAIKRSDFGMTKFLPGISDEVKIDIEAEANKEATGNAS